MRNILGLFFIPLLFGCAPAPEAKRPQRILSLSCGATGVLTALGAPPRAIDEYGVIAAGSPPPPVIGKGSAVSLEKMAELGIDCVVLWYYQNGAETLFRNRGVRVEVVPPPRLAGHARLIRRLGVLTGKETEAGRMADEFERKLAEISVPEEKNPARVWFELYAPGKGAGDESYIGDLIRASGGRAILRKSGLTAAESIIGEAPEVIFFIEGYGSAAEIASRPGFSALPAVKNKRIFPVPRRLTVEGAAPLECIGYLKKKLEK